MDFDFESDSNLEINIYIYPTDNGQKVAGLNLVHFDGWDEMRFFVCRV